MNRFKNKLKKWIYGTLIATSLTLGICTNLESRINNTLNLLPELVKLDKDYEPEHELKLEDYYGINILGTPNNLTEDNLQSLEDYLSIFEPSQTSGLNIALGNESKGNQLGRAGCYSKSTPYGPTVFIGQHSIIGHEIFHHIHANLPDKKKFDIEWYQIPTKIPLNGEFVEVTTVKAIRLLKREDQDFPNSWKIPYGNDYITGNEGLFGFVSPYGIGDEKNPLFRDNHEDVATYGEIMMTSEHNCSSSRLNIAYWDSNFLLDPYIKKINLLKKYGFIQSFTANATIDRLKDHYFAFAGLRNQTFFSELERQIQKLRTPRSFFKSSTRSTGDPSRTPDPFGSIRAHYEIAPNRTLSVIWSYYSINGPKHFCFAHFKFGSELISECLEWSPNSELRYFSEGYHNDGGESLVHSRYFTPEQAKYFEDLFTDVMESPVWAKEYKLLTSDSTK